MSIPVVAPLRAHLPAARSMSIVFIVSAPSGSGKSTLVGRLLESDPQLLFSTSYTTRMPRLSEVEGREYNFISRTEFEERMAQQEFLEHAEVFGNYYGTHCGALERAERGGKDLVLDIDVQGARQLKIRLPGAVSVFVLPPSREILEQRLRMRSADTETVIERRLRGAAAEVRNYQQYDYVLINNDLEESVARLRSIVTAERSRRKQMEQEVRPILESFERYSPYVGKNQK